MISPYFVFQPQTNQQFLLNHFTQTINDALWRVKRVNIPAQSHDFNIIIEGIRGPDFGSDAAIDDIKIHSGICR